MSNLPLNTRLAQLCLVTLVATVLLVSGTLSQALAQAKATRTILPPQDASLYAVDPQPLTVTQCGQCHPRHFADIKDAGGKHQFDCRECHEIFHAYNPLKNNYAEIMPQCVTCHGEPHGEKHVSCQNCHGNPHAPSSVALTDQLAVICSDCHSPQATELQQFVSKHTEQDCSSCHHSQHGYIPDCSECHEPHFEAQTVQTCADCHPVHQPLTIALSTSIDLRTCDACHSDVYSKWGATPSKHGQVNCAECHNAHGMIPECSNCHTPPPSHNAQLLSMFPKCLECHLDVHDLPVK